MPHPWSICRGPEERVAQPSQEVVNQAVQNQSPQPQAGRSQDMSQPQIWTAQTLMSLQHQTSSISSTSPAAKAMESHPVEEEAIRQRTDAASMEHLTASEERVAQPSQKVVNQGSAESESTAAGGTITGYVAAANMDNPDDDVFAASDIVHFSGSESHGKPSGGRSDTTEDRSRTYGASVGTEERVAQPSQKVVNQAVQEPESAVASGTIARYVAATGLDNSDVAVFTA